MKQAEPCGLACQIRRLFTEAWIETLPKQLTTIGGRRLFTEAWIETRKQKKCLTYQKSRLFTEAWIETNPASSLPMFVLSPLHGGVD